MDKANIIISIIIVLCIATAVAAYGIINNDNVVFSDLDSLSSDDGDNSGNGIGNNTTNTNGTGSSSSSGSGSGSGSSGSSTGSSRGSGSGSSSGSGSGTRHSSSSGGSSSGGGGSSSSTISQSQAKSIASSHIAEAGCYAGTPSDGGTYWIVPVYDSNGTAVDSITVDKKTGATGRG